MVKMRLLMELFSEPTRAWLVNMAASGYVSSGMFSFHDANPFTTVERVAPIVANAAHAAEAASYFCSTHRLPRAWHRGPVDGIGCSSDR